MPITIDDLDSPTVPDAQQSFVGGQFSNAVPLQLSADQCYLIEDCDVSVTGAASTRRGTDYLGGQLNSTTVKALGYYKTATADYAVALSSNQPERLNGSTWVDLGTKTLGAGTQATFVEGNGYLYVTSGAGNIARWDGASWTDLTTDSPPTSAQLMIWGPGNRLVVANTSNSVDGVFFSGLQDDAKWASLDGGYQIQPGGGDGSEITGLANWQNFDIACFKRNSVWIIGADPGLDVSQFEVKKVHSRIGCVAPLSVVQVGSDIVFLSDDGVRSLQQTLASDTQYDLGIPLSFPIQDILKRINRAAQNKAAAIFWQGLYILALPLDTSATNNYIVVYNTVTSKWSGGWTNLPVSCFGIRNDSGVNKLMMGLADDNRVIEYLDYVAEADATDDTYTDYDGTPVNPHIITRGMIFGDLDSRKKGLNANIKLFRSKGRVQIKAIFDEGEFAITKTINTGDPFGVHFPVTFPVMFPRVGVQPATMFLTGYPHFHQIQFELTGLDVGRKEFRNITTNAFLEAVDLKGRFEAV